MMWIQNLSKHIIAVSATSYIIVNFYGYGLLTM